MLLYSCTRRKTSNVFRILFTKVVKYLHQITSCVLPVPLSLSFVGLWPVVPGIFMQLQNPIFLLPCCISPTCYFYHCPVLLAGIRPTLYHSSRSFTVFTCRNFATAIYSIGLASSLLVKIRGLIPMLKISWNSNLQASVKKSKNNNNVCQSNAPMF